MKPILWIALSLISLGFMGTGKAATVPATPVKPPRKPDGGTRASVPKPPKTESKSFQVTANGRTYDVTRVDVEGETWPMVYVQRTIGGKVAAMRTYQGDRALSTYIDSAMGEVAETAHADLVADVASQPGNFGLTYAAGTS